MLNQVRHFYEENIMLKTKEDLSSLKLIDFGISTKYDLTNGWIQLE